MKLLLVTIVVLCSLCLAVATTDDSVRSSVNSGAEAAALSEAASLTNRAGGWKRVKKESRITGSASLLTKSDAFCVICQFAVERIHADLVQLAPGVYLQSGETAALPKSAQPTAFLETDSDIALESELADALAVDRRRGGRKGRGVQGVNTFEHGGIITPRRYRAADILSARPARVRFNHLNTPSPDPNREAARAAYRHLYQSVYASFEALCTRRMPFAYLPYCKTMLKSYRYIAQGIHYGDRPEQICINGGFCDKRSYVRKTIHTLYKPEPGDAYSKGK
jgi:hypothetical protein